MACLQIVIPAYNEFARSRICCVGSPRPLLVGIEGEMDDGSMDGTRELLRGIAVRGEWPLRLIE